MCTVTFIPRADGCFVAMNRDERIARSSATPPAVFDGGLVKSIYPLDCEGGTWVAANSAGIVFTLLNWNDIPALYKKSRSRGHIVPALIGSDCSQSADLALRRLDLKGILPFRLVGIFPHEERVIEWAWNQQSIGSMTSPWNSRQWCSSSLSDAAATTARGRILDRDFRMRGAGSLTWVRQLHASHDAEVHPFSYCVHRRTVETVSYTELVCSGERIDCRYLAGSPCKNGRIQAAASIRLVRRLESSSVIPVNKTETALVSPYNK
jgi:hypothetical protein